MRRETWSGTNIGHIGPANVWFEIMINIIGRQQDITKVIDNLNRIIWFIGSSYEYVAVY
jgi:hypothetical protein